MKTSTARIATVSPMVSHQTQGATCMGYLRRGRTVSGGLFRPSPRGQRNRGVARDDGGAAKEYSPPRPSLADRVGGSIGWAVLLGQLGDDQVVGGVERRA